MKLFAFLLLNTISPSLGNKPFNNLNQICCKGSAYDILPESEGYVSQCCGTEFFQYHKNDKISSAPMCCGGNFVGNYESTSRCCGSESYDTRNSACFNNSEIIPIPKPNIDRNETKICGISRAEMAFFDPDQNLCCSGVLHKTDQHLDCCGNATYNTVTSLCCNGNMFEGEFEKQCCGDSLYDTREATCCSTLVKTDEDSKDGQWIPTVAYYNQKDPNKSGCCGGEIVDFNTEICCKSGPKNLSNADIGNGSLFCCGDEIMTDFKIQVCVDDKIVVRKNENQGVCGNQLFNFGDYICYNNTLIENRRNETFCYENGLWRHPTKQICCQDSVIDLNEDDRNHERINCCDESLSGHLIMFGVDK